MDESWLAGAALASTGLVLVPFALALARRWMPRRRVFFARWGFSHAFALVAAWILLGPLVQLVLPQAGSAAVASIVASVVLTSALALGAVLFALRLDPDGVAALGLAREGSLRGLVVGCVTYVLWLPMLHGLERVWPHLAEALSVPAGMQPVLREILALEGGERALVFALAIVVVPFIEELVFRGFLQPLLVQNFREAGGIVLTSFLFAILHGTHALLPILTLSLLLGWLQVQTHRLSAPYAAHALNNALTCFLVEST